MKIIIPLEPHTAGRPRFSSRTGKVTRTIMDQGYREWRIQFDRWFEDYLNRTHDELLNFLTEMSDGRPIRNEKTGRLIGDFNGYIVRIICVIRRPKGNLRAFPVATNTADLDNYFKAVTDGMFESKPFKTIGINDRWIQTIQANKRYTALGTYETPHIEVEIQKIELEGPIS